MKTVLKFINLTQPQPKVNKVILKNICLIKNILLSESNKQVAEQFIQCGVICVKWGWEHTEGKERQLT